MGPNSGKKPEQISVQIKKLRLVIDMKIGKIKQDATKQEVLLTQQFKKQRPNRSKVAELAIASEITKMISRIHSKICT